MGPPGVGVGPSVDPGVSVATVLNEQCVNTETMPSSSVITLLPHTKGRQNNIQEDRGTLTDAYFFRLHTRLYVM